jgi:hypothetical protein
MHVYKDANIEKCYSSYSVYAKDVNCQLVLAKVQYFTSQYDVYKLFTFDKNHAVLHV